MVTINFIVQLIINQFNILNLANLKFTGIIMNFTNYSNFLDLLVNIMVTINIID